MSGHRHCSSRVIYYIAVPHYRARKMSLLYDSLKIKTLEIELCIPILLQFHKTVKKFLHGVCVSKIKYISVNNTHSPG